MPFIICTNTKRLLVYFLSESQRLETTIQILPIINSLDGSAMIPEHITDEWPLKVYVQGYTINNFINSY